jgi:HAMP domain-containing protein
VVGVFCSIKTTNRQAPKTQLMNRIKRLPSIPIRYAIPLLLATFIIAATGLNAWLSFRSGQRAINNLAFEVSEEATTRIEGRVTDFLEIPSLFHQINLANRNAGNLDLTNYAQVRDAFYNQVKISESVPYLYMGTEAGDFLGVDSNFGGDAVYKIRDAQSSPERITFSLDNAGIIGDEISRKEYDPRTRPWYQSAVELGELTWSPVYLFSAKPILGISPVQPIYNDDGTLFGVLGIDLTLSELTNFLRSLSISESGEAVIIERDGNLVATSTGANPFSTNSNGEEERINIVEINNPLVQSTAEVITERFGGFNQEEISRNMSLEVNGQRRFIRISRIRNGQGLDWLTMVVIPEEDYTATVFANLRNTLTIGLVVLVVATILGFLVAQWLIQPITTIIDTAAAIEKDDFNLTPLDAIAERTDEFGQLGRVFKNMGQEVFARQQKLKQQVQELLIEIDVKKKEKEVEDIVGSDFFADLKTKAKQMRKRQRH